MNRDPWNAVYKFASFKIQNKSVLPTLRKEDCTYKENQVEIMNNMMENFTGKDNEEMDIKQK